MKPVIDVLVEFLSTDEGGRKSPIYIASGIQYRPHFRVIGAEEHLGVQFIEGPRTIEPRKKIACKVMLLYYPNVSYENLTNGSEFDILEGQKIVGKGIVINT